MLKTSLATILDLILPNYCLLCFDGDQLLCQSCEKKLLRANQTCLYCLKASPLGFSHPACKPDLGLDGVFSVYDYKDPKVKKIITSGKYNFISNIFLELSQYASIIIKNESSQFFFNKPLCPIPLSWARQNYRSFNQAEIITRIFQNSFAGVYFGILKRKLSFFPQVKLKKLQRQKNIQNQFYLPDKKICQNLTIILIDDVITTGATLKEACKVLKRDGASKVYAITLAKD